MDPQLLKNALGNALVDLSTSVFPTLLSSDDPAEAVATRALCELNKLASGNELPSYDRPEVGLFYAQWYQAQQVNLAYSIVSAASESHESSIWPDSNGRLHIVDYGSGAFAVSFGVAFALADRIEMNLPVPDVTVTAIDCAPMHKIGSQLWQQFGRRVRGESGLEQLGLALGNIEHTHVTPEQIASVMPYPPRPAYDRTWLTAFHVAYESNRDVTASALAQLSAMLRPDTGIITTPSGKSAIAASISPFDEPIFGQYELKARFPFSGDMPKITRWRKDLRKSFETAYELGGLLMTSVSCTGAEQTKLPQFGFYTRR